MCPVEVIQLLIGPDAFSGEYSTEECDDVYAAQCMGAPCWDISYDSVWNITCICPYVTKSSTEAKEMFNDICDKAESGGDCALVGFGSDSTEYDAEGLREMVEAVMDATPTIDTETCRARDSGR